jgi:glutamyl-tRNA reductase
MMKKRKGNPSCMIDIAVPRDIEPSVGKIDNVFYNDIDSLQTIVDQNLKKRKEEIPLVSNIVMEEMVNLFSWYNTLEVVPTIKSFRDFFEEIRNDELDKLKNKVCEEDIEKIDDMTRRLIGRILHNPTVKLRELAESGSNVQEASTNALIIKELFGLEKRNGHPNNDSQNSEEDY